MDAKEDTSLSGFSSVSSDKIETVNDTNGFNSINKIDDSNNIVSSLNTVSDDETEGFASGEEEAFETVLDENLVLEKETAANVDEGEDDNGESFSEASEFLAPKVESAPVSDEVVDDAEKVNLDLVENSESDSKADLVDETASETVKSGGTDKGEKEVVVAENGVKVTAEGDSIVEEIKVETPAPGLAVVTNTDEVLDEDEDDDEDEGVLLVGGPDDSKTVVETETETETPALDSVADDVKVTSEDDSVVETVESDLPPPSVVTHAEMNVETPALEPVGANDVTVTSEGDVKVTSEGDSNDVKKSYLDAVVTNDVKATSEGDVKVTSEGDSIDVKKSYLDAVVANDVKVTSEGDVKVTSEGDSIAEAVESDLPPPPPVAAELAAVETPAVTNFETPDLKSDDVKITSEQDSVVESRDFDLPPPPVVAVAKPAVTNVETPDLEPVDATDVKITSEHDFVVGSRDVDLPPPPVAAEVAAVETPAVTNVETPDSESFGVNDEKLTSEHDSVVETVNVDLPIPGVAEVAVVTQVEEDGADVAVTDEKIDRVLEEVVDKEVVGVVTDGKFAPLEDEDSVTFDVEKNEKNPEAEIEKEIDYDSKETEVVGEDNSLENGPADKFVLEDSAEKDETDEEETDGVIFGSSEAAKQFMEELEGGDSINGGESSQDRSQIMDGQIVTDSDEEDDEEEDGKELFDSAALAALLKAAADGGSEGGNITFSSQDGSRLFTVERPAGLGPSLRAAPRPARSNVFNPLTLVSQPDTESNLTEDERKKLEKLQAIRVKFLRLMHKLGLSIEESVAAQVLYRLALIAGRQTDQSFSLDAAKQTAMELESEENNELDFSVNILVVGKAGVGKSATINSIFGEEKTGISAFQPATGSVKKISGLVNGVLVNVFDTPGLKSSVMEQGYNRSVLSSAKKLTKKSPPDIFLYVDRLDAQTRDLNDIPLLKTITGSLGQAIWRSAIVTFTHGASAPPEGSNGLPLSYEMFVTQRSHVVQQAIGHAVGDLRMMSPSLMTPVSLVENHQSCRKNRDGQKVLPNGQTWRPQLLMLCYSIKILAEANALSKPQDPYDNRKLFGFRVRSPPLPYMLSSMLQSRAHPKLSSEGGDGGDSDADLAELTDSDREDEEDEYDQLPPFKPLKKSQLSKLSKEQKKAYFDEYDYRVKLLQKKQWKEELKRMKEMKKRGVNSNSNSPEQSFPEEEGDGDAPAPVAVPLPDMALPPSFDSDNPAYRFRFLEPTSQFLARPVLDTHGWDHDCGYDGVNLEQSLAIGNRFPANVSVQLTKDKKDFSINLDSSISAKHGENVSTMAGFDIQPIGKQLAYIVRGETKFKNLKKNKTAAGMSVTFLGENIVTGFKLEDQIALGRQYSIIGSAGTIRFQTDSAYGANIEIQRRELDYPIGQIQSTVGLSIIKWRGDLALGLNSLAQFSAGRNSKAAVRAGINNKMSGQITVKTSSSEHLVLALAAVIPSVISAYKKLWPTAGEEKYSAY